MPIELEVPPEPHSHVSYERAVLTGLAPTSAEHELLRELRRYVNGEIVGRSILISGHRGAGKTTLVRGALQKVYLESREHGTTRPLYVALNGPTLIRDVESRAQLAPETEPDTTKSDDDKSVEDLETEEAEANAKAEAKAEVEPSLEKEKVRLGLMEITVALYRALADEYARSYLRALRRRDDFESRRLELNELAAQFRWELDGVPSPALIREFWSLAGAMETGVLFRSGSKQAKKDTQPAREMLALATAAHANGIVSGTITQTRNRSTGKQQTTVRSNAGAGSEDGANPNLQAIVSALVAVAAGSGSFLAAGGDSDVGTAVVAAIVGVLSFAGLNFVTTRTRTKQQAETYSIAFNRTLSSLDRELPKLADRVRQTGLAPVFVVDELDKLKDLGVQMEEIVKQLKHFVVDKSFFCFLTDREYFEELERGRRKPGYAREHTYFSRRLFVTYRFRDLHDFIAQRIRFTKSKADDGTATAEQDDYAVLPFILLYESKFHMFDLTRTMSGWFGADGRLDAYSPGEIRRSQRYLWRLKYQIAVEILLRDDEVDSRIAADAHNAQLIYDALYYPASMLEDDQLTQEDFTPEVLVAFLERQANSKEGNDAEPVPANGLEHGSHGEYRATVTAQYLFGKVRELLKLIENHDKFLASISAVQENDRGTGLRGQIPPAAVAAFNQERRSVESMIECQFDSPPYSWQWKVSKDGYLPPGDQAHAAGESADFVRAVQQAISALTSDELTLGDLASPLRILSTTPTWDDVEPLLEATEK